MIVQSYPFFVNLSYHGFLKIIKMMKKTRLRAWQVYLFVQYYSKGGERCLGRVRVQGGGIIYQRDFLKRLRAWTGLSKRQVYRYIKELRDSNYIQKVETLRGWEYRLNPNSPLLPRYCDDYFRVPLAGMGGKGIDIISYLEKIFKMQDHPQAESVKFYVSRQTRKYRGVRHDRAVADFEKRKKVSHLVNYVYSKNSILRDRNTKRGFLKSGYGGYLQITTKRGPPVRVPWWKAKRLSEFQKVSCGIPIDSYAIFYQGRAYQGLDLANLPRGYVYESVDKPVKPKVQISLF